MRRSRRAALGQLAALALLPSAAGAQARPWPAKPVKLIIPFAAGGSTDVVGRVIAQKLGDALGHPFIVENRPGASGNLGVESVAKSVADGYTLVLVTVAYAINQSLFKKLPFEPSALSAVGMVASAPNMLVVHPSVPASDVRQFVSLAKQQGLFYGSAGSGTPTHLSAELFNHMAGVSLTHVPYKGGSLAINDLLGGQVKVMFAGIMTAIPYVKAGRLRPLAVTGATRSKVAPDVPTLSEAGLAGYEAMNWYALLAPSETPRAIVDRLNQELNRILQMPEVVEILEKDGAEPQRTSIEEAQAQIRSEVAKWRAIVSRANITPN